MSHRSMDSVREGQVLAGKYRVERVLGQGGMGVVVAAMHQQLEQRVALKFLLPEAEDQDSRVRFLREARAAVRLKSEHVARVLDVGTLDVGSPYIVMEFLEGSDLAAVLEARGRLPLQEAIEYVLQACEAIAEAHALGIVHRDLKPSNLFLTRRSDSSPCVKVLDFGISKVATPEGVPAMTHNAVILGTPQYMSPEQLRSSRDVDARSDVWAMGMIFYELLTGTTPFLAETLPELCTAILIDAPTPVQTHVPEVPAEIEQIVLRALEKNRDQRYPSLAALARDLAPFLSGGFVAARKIAHILEMAPVPALAPPENAPTARASLPVTDVVADGPPRPSSVVTLPTMVAEAPAVDSRLPVSESEPAVSSSSPALVGPSSASLPGLSMTPVVTWKTSLLALGGLLALAFLLLVRAPAPSPAAPAGVAGAALHQDSPVASHEKKTEPPTVAVSVERPPNPPEPAVSIRKTAATATPPGSSSGPRRKPPVNPGKKPGLTSDFGSRK